MTGLCSEDGCPVKINKFVKKVSEYELTFDVIVYGFREKYLVIKFK